MATPSIIISSTVYPDAELLEITDGVGATPARCTISLKKFWADTADANVFFGAVVQVFFGGVRVFYGHIYDFDPRTIAPREDSVTVVAFDLRQAMKRVCIGDPSVLRESKMGQDIFFNEGDINNRDADADPPRFAPLTMDAAEAVEWTFADALEYIFRVWVAPLGLPVSFNKANFLTQAHAAERLPPLNVTGLNCTEAIDAIVKQWGFGNWFIDPVTLGFYAVTTTNPLLTVRTLRLFDKSNIAVPADTDDWSATEFRLHENLSSIFNNSSVLSARKVIEKYYYYRSAGAVAGDLLKKDGAWVSTPEQFLRLIADPSQYAAAGLGDNLSANSWGKPVLAERITAPARPPETVETSAEISIDGGATWRKLHPDEEGRNRITIGIDPLEIILPRDLELDDDQGVTLDPSDPRFQPFIFRIILPTVTEDRMSSNAGVGNASLARRRLVVREDVKPLVGFDYDNTATVQTILDNIKGRAAEFEGKRMIMIEVTLCNLVTVNIGDKVVQASGPPFRVIDTAGWDMFVVALTHAGGTTQQTRLVLSNVLGEPSTYIANAVFNKAIKVQ